MRGLRAERGGPVEPLRAVRGSWGGGLCRPAGAVAAPRSWPAFLARAPHRTPKRWLNGPIGAGGGVGVGERASLKAWAKQGGGDWCSPGWRAASKGYA